MNIVKISAHLNARIVKMDKRQLKNGLEMLEINIKKLLCSKCETFDG